MELYRVEVVAQLPLSLRLRLKLRHPCVFLGASFALMLIAEESAPQHEDYKRWLASRVEEDDGFDPLQAITRMEVLSTSGLPSAAAARAEEGDGEWLGIVDLEIQVAAVGMLQHLPPGASWWSTAYDELGDGTAFAGDPDDPRVWTKPAPVSRRAQAVSALEIVERGAAEVVVDVHALGELPAADPRVWIDLLRIKFPPLDRVHMELARGGAGWKASDHITAVAPIRVSGGRDAGGGSIKLSDDMQLRTKGALRGRYRVEAAHPDWLLEPPQFGPVMLSSWFPEDVLASAPEPSGAEDVEAFEELVALSQDDDFDTQLAILADGLEDTRDVVMAALKKIGALGDRAAPTALQVAALLGSVDTEVALAALATATLLNAPALGIHLALASWRTDRRIAAAAAAVLERWSQPPSWQQES